MDLLIALIISLGINILMFIPAYIWKTDKLTDISYTVTFVLLAFISLVISGVTLPSVILLGAIFLWASRLGGYLLIRIRKIGKDSRFDAMRESFWRFGRFWILQGFTVWVVLIPSILFINKAPESLVTLSYVGLIVWAIGLGIETIADFQKYRFINNPENKGKWIASGLWKYSRHPNYFGEILLWFGLYIFVFNAFSLGEALVGLVGPLYIALLIIFVSGIPLLEKGATKRWGDNPEYKRYRQRTSMLIPWFNKNI
ncbi:DUF1295 domain-containing protein [Candidatus Dojkabacteria bacterium]|uniref:DUF1295 domain-containing protein n=1 Tax=Candidatus Dojkabacteria bacterium TaxID=2099670 RepID=A0A955HYW3_9BACT|nr:DUF1295 domain-containing protein [Candidatus Dojkabacteria bacterium]